VIAAGSDPIFGLIGDSRMASAFVTGGVAPTTTVRNPPHSISGWAALLSGQRIKVSSAYNKAASGSLVSDLAGQYAQLQAVTPVCTHVLILSGTNSFAAGVTGSAAWATMAALIATVIASGRRPIIILDLPRAVATWTTAAAQNSFYFNQLARRNAPALGAIVIDPTKYLADPASSSGDPLSGYYYDGIHQATLAAYYCGLELSNAVLGAIGKPALPGFASRGDIYNVTNNPYGNATQYGLFTGTGGTNTSSGGAASGAVADGWNNRTLTGTGTSVASQVARTDGKPGNWQQFVLTSGSGTSTYRASLITNPAMGANYPSGTAMVLEADVNVSSATGLESFNIAVYNFDGATLYEGVQALGSTLINSTYYPFPSAFSGRLRTEPLPYNALANQLLVRIESQVNTGAATIQVGGLELRQV
jgi:hypothetical protein